jgi:hypothetical protein
VTKFVEDQSRVVTAVSSDDTRLVLDTGSGSRDGVVVVAAESVVWLIYLLAVQEMRYCPMASTNELMVFRGRLPGPCDFGSGQGKVLEKSLSPKILLCASTFVSPGQSNSDHSRKQFGIRHNPKWPLIERKRAFLVGGFRSPTNPSLLELSGQ